MSNSDSEYRLMGVLLYVLKDWRRVFIVSLYEGKSSRDECNSYREISPLSVPRKLHGRVLNERMKRFLGKGDV